MKVATEVLLKDLINRAKQNRATAVRYKDLALDILNKKASAESWSILECFEHLNLYAAFYVPEVRNRIRTTRHKEAAAIFKSGFLGDYFANSMVPKPGMKTMKTFADKNPNGSALDAKVLDRFIAFQDEWLVLLQEAAKINLNKTKTSITIKVLKLRMGDTLRFVFAHDERHIVQAHALARFECGHTV